MSGQHPEIVIVRRRSTLEDEHHGGAWKIAFADFMTAMMAFFLVLWIISATDKNTKTIIARYFNPVKVEEPARAQKGIHGALNQDVQTPAADSAAGNGKKSGSNQGDTGASSPAGALETTPKGAKSGHQAEVAPPDPARPSPTMSEEELFSDPRASLDRITGSPPPGPRVDPASAPLQGFGYVGPSSDNSFRDPFRPLGSDEAIHTAASADGGAPADEPREEPATTPSEPARDASSPGPEKHELTKPLPGSAPTAVRSEAALARDAKIAPQDAARTRAAALLAEVRNRLGAEAPSTPGPQLDVQATDEGLLISLTDRKNFSMFAIGSAEPQPRVVRMMDAIAASSQDDAGRDRGARPHRRPSLPLGPLRQLAPVLRARADGLLHVEPRRNSGEAFRANRGLCRPSAQGPGQALRGGKPSHRDPAARGEAVSWRFALLIAALLSAEPTIAGTGSVRISDMTEELQRIQTRIAHGDKVAYAAQLTQLKAIGAAIAAARPETWQDKREADSLVIYVLSGGSLADVAPLIGSDVLVESERPLARGAAAYITSHEADALRLLGAIDLDSIDARVAGEVAFARSVLETKHDPKAAISLLDWARLLAPGGLVEEAALRREIAMLAEARDAQRAARLTREYAIRFGPSLYAPDFFRELARLIGGSGLADDPGNYKLFSDAASDLPTAGRLEFLLTLARAAIVNGRFAAASAAATEALRSVAPNGAEEARARLYLNAARIFSDGYDSALTNLQGLENSKLDRSDMALLAAFRDAAAQFRLAPSPAFIEAQAAAADEEKEGAALTIRDAEAALKRTASAAQAGGGP